jgi:hypothetical protein
MINMESGLDDVNGKFERMRRIFLSLCTEEKRIDREKRKATTNEVL